MNSTQKKLLEIDRIVWRKYKLESYKHAKQIKNLERRISQDTLGILRENYELLLKMTEASQARTELNKKLLYHQLRRKFFRNQLSTV